MDGNKFKLLVMAVREALIQFIGALEDYLDIGHERSALAKRREKVK